MPAPDALPSGTPVLIYTRISPGHGEDNVSLDAMEVECRAFCAARAWQVIQVIADDRISGKSVDDRPGFREVLALARRRPPPFKAVVFWKQSRVFRNVEEFYAYGSILRRSGVQLVSVKEPLPSGALGEAMAGILAIVDQLYAHQVSEDTRRNLKHLVSQGYWPGGRPPVGGRLEKVVVGHTAGGEDLTRTKLVPDPAMAPRVRQAFEMDAKDVKAAEIVAETGICTTINSLCDILVNETYGDHLVYNRRRQNGGRNKRVKNDPDERVIGEGHGLHIVPQDLLERVIAKRRARATGPLARIGSPYLLSDLLMCACGGRMKGKGRRGERLYACSRRRLPSCGLAPVPAVELERIVLTAMRDDYGSLANLRAGWQRLARAQRSGTAEGRAQLAALRTQLGAVQAERERYLAAIRDGVRGADLAAPLATCTDTISRLQEKIALASAPTQPLQVTDALVQETRDAFLRRLAEEPATVLAECIDRLVVDGKQALLTIQFASSGDDLEPATCTAYARHTVGSRQLLLSITAHAARPLPRAILARSQPGPKPPRTHRAAARRNAEMIARRRAGEKLRTLAADYGIGIQRVSAICRRAQQR